MSITTEKVVRSSHENKGYWWKVISELLMPYHVRRQKVAICSFQFGLSHSGLRRLRRRRRRQQHSSVMAKNIMVSNQRWIQNQEPVVSLKASTRPQDGETLQRARHFQTITTLFTLLVVSSSYYCDVKIWGWCIFLISCKEEQPFERTQDVHGPGWIYRPTDHEEKHVQLWHK